MDRQIVVWYWLLARMIIMAFVVPLALNSYIDLLNGSKGAGHFLLSVGMFPFMIAMTTVAAKEFIDSGSELTRRTTRRRQTK